MKKDVLCLVWVTGCTLLAVTESLWADAITYTCPAYTALTPRHVLGNKDTWTYTGNLVGGSTPKLTIGQWILTDIPIVTGFSQASFEASGPSGTPVLNCWYGGAEFGSVSPLAVNGQANLPSDKTCRMGGHVDAEGNCTDTDPTKCPVVCSD